MPSMSREKMIDSRFAVPAFNLLTNPSFEAAGTANGVTVRTNLHLNPRAGLASSTTLGFWWHQLGTTEAATLTHITGAVDGPLPGVATYYRKTVTTAKTTGNSGIYTRNGSPTPGVTIAGASGDTLTVSIYVRPSVTLNLSCSSQPRLAGAVSGSASQSAAVSCPAGVWTRLSHTYVTTAAYDDVQVWAVEGSTAILPVGATMDATCVQVEKAPVLQPYFDGSAMSTPDSDLNVAWSGTANASTSLLRGTAPASTAVNIVGNVQSSQWSSNRAKSLRLIPAPDSTGAVNSGTFVFVGGASATAMNNGMVAGRTYTAIGKVRLPAVQTGTISTQARRIAIQYNTVVGLTGATVVASPQPPNTVGVHEARVTVTLPANAVWARVVVYNGTTVATPTDVWWDDVMLVEGTYTGAYWDGSFRNAGWTGAPDASTSVTNGWVNLT